MSFATKRSRKMKTTIVPQVKASVAHSDMRHAALRTAGLLVLEDIAYSPQSPNQWPLPVAVDLAAKAIDVDIDYICVGLNAHAPNLVKDHGARDHPACVATQVFEKHEFLRRKLQRLARSRGFAPQ